MLETIENINNQWIWPDSQQMELFIGPIDSHLTLAWSISGQTHEVNVKVQARAGAVFSKRIPKKNEEEKRREGRKCIYTTLCVFCVVYFCVYF